MAFDVAVGWALGKLYGLAGKWLANVVGQIFIAINPNVAAGLIFAIVGYGKSPTSSNPSAMEYIFSTGVGILGGSPLGYNAGKDQSVLWDRTLGPGGWMDRTFGVHAPSGDDAFNFGRGLFGD